MKKYESFKIYKSEFTIGHRRFIAAMIDLAIILIVGEYLENILIKLKTSETVIVLIFYTIIAFMFFCKDCIFKNGSIGKKIMQIAIYDKETNKYATNKIKIKRNLMILNDFSSIEKSILKNERSADIKYNTYVDLIKK